METVFQGLKVVEIGEGMAVSMASMILADNGAEVIKVEPPTGDSYRGSRAFPMWNRGKRSVVIDLDSAIDRRRAMALIESADIVIEMLRPGIAEQAGLHFGAVSARNPRLVYCSITGFGLVDRYEYLEPVEGIVTARCGRSNNNDKLSGAHYSGRPIHIAAPINSCGAAFLAVQGITGALTERLSSGIGQRVETSLVDGMSAATMRLAFERQGDRIVPVGKRGHGSSLLIRCIANCFLTAECADGRYIQMCARQPHHFMNWLKALDITHILTDSRFEKAPFGLASHEDADALEELLRDAMRRKTQSEWMDVFKNQWDVGGDPFLTPEEFLDHPQMLANGRVITVQDREYGSVRQIGPLVQFGQTPSRIEAGAPLVGEHQCLLPEPETLPPLEHVPVTGSSNAGAVFAGRTVLELAYYLAAPLGGTMLAEMGARVIKVEPLEGDPFRKAGLEFVHIVHGKESIALDMKSNAGREIFHRLVSKCDALYHNFRPGVPERLGADYETIRKINPGIVYLYGASYGSKGPERLRPAFHSTPNALCGGGILQAGKGNPPIDDSYPDPIAGLGVGVALAMGLYHRARTGQGQYMETTMLTSSGYVHSEILTEFPSAPPRQQVDRRQMGFGALYRLYECKTGWIFLSARTHHEWRQLTFAIGQLDLLGDRRFCDAAARRQNDAVLAGLLESVFRQRDNADWEKEMARSGVPCAVVAESFEEFLADNDALEEGEHPSFGSYWRLQPRLRFSRSSTHAAPPSAIGEHTLALLGECGFSATEIDQMLKLGVVKALQQRQGVPA